MSNKNDKNSWRNYGIFLTDKNNWKHLPPYDPDKYGDSRTFNTADIVLMSVIDNEMGVLLIQRGEDPYKGAWALPGGFMQKQDYDILETAKRELKEETGLDGIYLEQLACYSKQGRDPREFVATKPIRIISEAHLALIDHTKVKAVAGDDAAAVRWHKLSELPELAFDHAEIIEAAIARIRNKIGYTNLGFELVPTEFTIPELRSILEKVLGRRINPANFRTKLLKLKVLKKTKKKVKKGRGQPAPVYMVDRDKLKKLPIGETLFN